MPEVDATTLAWLEQEIDKHQTWRRVWSVCYSGGASITVIAGALATASAGFMDTFHYGQIITATLAGLTTIFASLEKVLKLREKWDLHRNVQVALEMINLRAAAGLIDNEQTVNLIEKTAHTYSLQLADLNAAGGDSPPV
jgi:hypothetical protein